MYDEEESGGIMEKSLSKEKRDWSVVVKETATAMVCIKLVKRKVLVHFWPLLKAISTSFTSAFTNRSIVSVTPLFSLKLKKMKRVWLSRDFENDRMKNKSTTACLNMEPYISHVRRKVYHGVRLLQVVPCCLAIDENLIMLTSC